MPNREADAAAANVLADGRDHAKAVIERLDEAVYPRRFPNGQHHPSVRAYVVARVRAGEKPYAVARDLGIPASTVHVWIAGPSTRNYKRRGRPPVYSDFQVRRALRLYADGMSFLGVSKMIGCQLSTVRRWVLGQLRQYLTEERA